MEKSEYWYRRLAHVAGTSFILYYVIPDDGYIGFLKKVGLILFFVSLLSFDLLRLIKRGHKLKGLREYEKERIGSYVYFAMGSVILLLFFPQQISIPCIVSASIIDPVLGEMRKINPRLSYLISILLSFFIFYAIWLTSPHVFLISSISSISQTLSEVKKSRCIDDDLLMQITPATLLLVICSIFGFEIMPRKIILPLFG